MENRFYMLFLSLISSAIMFSKAVIIYNNIMYFSIIFLSEGMDLGTASTLFNSGREAEGDTKIKLLIAVSIAIG